MGIFELVQQDCSKELWSKAVALVRDNAVSSQKNSDSEKNLLVLNKKSGVSHIVTLWPEDGDWRCDCAGDQDPCEHVAAAVIALRQAAKLGTKLRETENTTARLEYHFHEKPEGAYFERRVVWGGGYEVLAAKLNDPSKLRVQGHAVAPTNKDILVDRALTYQNTGVLDRNSMKALIEALVGCDRVFFAGKKYSVSPKPTGLHCIVEDQGALVSIRGKLDPNIKKHFPNGIALTNSGLAYMRPVALPTELFNALKQGRTFKKPELGQLAAVMIPKIKEHAIIVNHSTQLPEVIKVPPRIAFRVNAVSVDTVSITPEIVYGSPEIAIVRNDRLTLVGEDAPVRDHEQERILARSLYTQHGLNCGESLNKKRAKALAFIDIVTNSGPFSVQESSDSATLEIHGPIQPEISSTDWGFTANFTSKDKHGGIRSCSIEELSEACTRGDSYVKLIDGGYAPAPNEWFKKYGHKVLDLISLQKKEGELPKSCLPAASQLAQELNITPPSPVISLRKRLSKIKDSPFNLNAEFTAKLRPYQIEGVKWLNFVRNLEMGALLADDMGLGKTVQTIAVMKGPSLVICPTSVLPNWISEITKFAPYLNPIVYHGVSRSFPAPEDNDVIVTTFGLLRSDIGTLANINWETVVVDEAQNIKNPKSLVSKAAMQIKGKFKVALTGTPLENRLEDLFAQFNFLNPGMLGSQRSFSEQYVTDIQKGLKGPAKRLQSLIGPFIMRRNKEEVLKELPPKTEKELYIELSEDEQKAYDGLLSITRQEVLSKLNEGNRTIEMLELLLRLRQAACSLSLLPAELDLNSSDSTKTKVLLEKLEQVAQEGHKALVFSQWTSYLDLIEEDLKKHKINYIRLDGSSRNRGDIVKTFQNDDQLPVLLMSLKAGGVGLNLTAADHVFIMDPWWNPAAEDQAADRAHRIGQNRPVMVYRLISKGTVEERIMLLKEKKKYLAEDMLSGATRSAITKEDIMDLLN